MTNTLKLQFKEVDDEFTVYDVRRQVPIVRTPIWLSAVDAFVGKSEPRTLEFATSRPKKRHITILDVNEKEVISLVFFQKVLTVNDRFHLDDKGVVSYNVNDSNGISEPVACKIRTFNNADVFKVRVWWYGHKFTFDIHPIVGPLLVDSRRPVNKGNDNFNVFINVENMDIAEAAEVSEGAIGGIVQTVGGAQQQAGEMKFSLRIDHRDFDSNFAQTFSTMLRETIGKMTRIERPLQSERRAIVAPTDTPTDTLTPANEAINEST